MSTLEPTPGPDQAEPGGASTGAAPTPPHATSRSARGRSARVLRRGLTWILVVLFAIGTTGTVFALWADSQIFDTDTYIATVGPIPGDPAVVAAVSTQVSQSIVESLHVEGVVARVLPAEVEGLAALVAAGVKEGIRSAIAQFMASPQFTDAWVTVNRAVHERLVAILHGDAATISDAGGQLTLNVFPLVDRGIVAMDDVLTEATGRDVALPDLADPTDPVASRAQIEEALGITLPDGFGEIVIAETAALEQAQTTVRVFETSILISALVTLLLVILAVAVALNRRRALLQVVIAGGIGLAVAGVLVARLGQVVSDFAPEGVGGTLGRVTVERIVSGFDDFVLVFVVIAIVLAIALYIAGRPAWLPRWGRSASQSLGVHPSGNALVRFVSEHVGELRLAGYVVAIVALFLVPLGGGSIPATLVILVAYQVVLTVIRAFRPAYLRTADEPI